MSFCLAVFLVLVILLYPIDYAIYIMLILSIVLTSWFCLYKEECAVFIYNTIQYNRTLLSRKREICANSCWSQQSSALYITLDVHLASLH